MYQVTDQTGRRFVVTGANSGTGKKATRRIAAAGGHVVMAVRSKEKGHTAAEEILRDVPEASLEVRRLDLADLASVHAFVEGILDDGVSLDVLINNVGVMAVPDRTLTVDGFELQQFARSDSPLKAYGQSKLADLLMGLHLARVADECGGALLSTMANPGNTRTNLHAAGPNLGRGKTRFNPLFDLPIIPSQHVVTGAEPLLFAATDPSAVQGAYYGPSRVAVGPTKRIGLPRSACGVDLAASLWSVAEDLTGTRLPAGNHVPSR